MDIYSLMGKGFSFIGYKGLLLLEFVDFMDEGWKNRSCVDEVRL